jgi:hypothetical protein
MAYNEALRRVPMADWVYEEETGEIRVRGGRLIAELAEADPLEPEDVRNERGRLIANAPELKEALAQIAELLKNEQHGSGTVMDQVRNIATDALAPVISRP